MKSMEEMTDDEVLAMTHRDIVDWIFSKHHGWLFERIQLLSPLYLEMMERTISYCLDLADAARMKAIDELLCDDGEELHLRTKELALEMAEKDRSMLQ